VDNARLSAKPEPVPYAHLSDPQTLNLYAYVRNNPLSRRDLDGHFDCSGTNAEGAGCQEIARWNAVHNGISRYNEGTSRSINATNQQTVSRYDGGTSGGVTYTTTTTKAIYSTEKGHEGEFLGATTRVQVTRAGDGEPRIISDTGEQQIMYLQAVRALGTTQMAEAQDVAIRSAIPGIFMREMGKDIRKHPFAYAMHAAGFALPFLEVPQAVEGLLTATEALFTAFDLQKEVQEQK
jgi:hypothetical protein